jgi:hypothetical protein
VNPCKTPTTLYSIETYTDFPQTQSEADTLPDRLGDAAVPGQRHVARKPAWVQIQIQDVTMNAVSTFAANTCSSVGLPAAAR